MARSLVAAESTNCQFTEMFWLGIHFVLDPFCLDTSHGIREIKYKVLLKTFFIDEKSVIEKLVDEKSCHYFPFCP